MEACEIFIVGIRAESITSVPFKDFHNFSLFLERVHFSTIPSVPGFIDA